MERTFHQRLDRRVRGRSGPIAAGCPPLPILARRQGRQARRGILPERRNGHQGLPATSTIPNPIEWMRFIATTPPAWLVDPRR